MSKPSSSRSILRQLCWISTKPSSLSNPNDLSHSSPISHFISHHPKVVRNPIFSPWMDNSRRIHSSSTPISRILQNPTQKVYNPNFSLLSKGRNFVGLRYFSADKYDAGKRMLGNPLGGLRDAVSRYREAVGLQIEAFWKRNSLVLVGAVGVGVCILLWRIMFGIANTFVGLSEGMAKYGFLALSMAMVSFAGLYIRSRYTINPDRVYRIAMRRLNTSAGILEVMGAPLSGTDLRAYVMSGGGVTLKNFKPRFRNKRCFLIFPIRGSERRGLVSVEVKNKKGQYDMKLLAVDIPMATGPDQRIYLTGDDEEYRIGGGLISELRDPVIKAMAASKEFEHTGRMRRTLKENFKKQRESAEKKLNSLRELSCVADLELVKVCI